MVGCLQLMVNGFANGRIEFPPRGEKPQETRPGRLSSATDCDTGETAEVYGRLMVFRSRYRCVQLTVGGGRD